MRPILTITLTVVAMLAHVAPGAACTCTHWPSLDEAFRASAAVFSGRVLDVREVELSHGQVVREVGFARIDAWKGAKNGHVTVRTAQNEAVCGYTFEIGEEYLVYAGSSAEALYVGLCGRTLRLDAAENDLKELGPPIYSVAVESQTWAAVKRLFKKP